MSSKQPQESAKRGYARAMNYLVSRAPAIAAAISAYVEELQREAGVPEPRDGVGAWRGQTRQTGERRR